VWGGGVALRRVARGRAVGFRHGPGGAGGWVGGRARGRLGTGTTGARRSPTPAPLRPSGSPLLGRRRRPRLGGPLALGCGLGGRALPLLRLSPGGLRSRRGSLRGRALPLLRLSPGGLGAGRRRRPRLLPCLGLRGRPLGGRRRRPRPDHRGPLAPRDADPPLGLGRRPGTAAAPSRLHLGARHGPRVSDGHGADVPPSSHRILAAPRLPRGLSELRGFLAVGQDLGGGGVALGVRSRRLPEGEEGPDGDGAAGGAGDGAGGGREGRARQEGGRHLRGRGKRLGRWREATRRRGRRGGARGGIGGGGTGGAGNGRGWAEVPHRRRQGLSWTLRGGRERRGRSRRSPRGGRRPLVPRRGGRTRPR